MAAPRYGVTAASVAASVLGYAPGPSSFPTADALDAIIERNADVVRGKCLAAFGVSGEGFISTDPAYGALAAILHPMCVAELLQSQGAGLEAQGWRASADQRIKALDTRPGEVANQSNAQTVQSTERWARDAVPDWGAPISAAGRIIRGTSL